MKSRKRKALRSSTSRTLYHRLGKVRHPRRAQRVGFVWYKPEQWRHLRELAADAEKLDETYEAWLSSAERTEADLRTLGILTERVSVDIDVLADWCRAQGRPFDSAARADYAAEAMRMRSWRS